MNFEQLIDDARTAKSDMMLSKSLLSDAIRDRFLPAYCAYCLEHGQGVSYFKGIIPVLRGQRDRCITATGSTTPSPSTARR